MCFTFDDVEKLVPTPNDWLRVRTVSAPLFATAVGILGDYIRYTTRNKLRCERVFEFGVSIIDAIG